MNCLLVPSMGWDLSLLTRLADSIDYPIRQKLIINNGKNVALVNEWIGGHPGWGVIHAPTNLGVAGSWNLAPASFVGENRWLIVNDDICFNPGQLRQLCIFADIHASEHIILADKGFECFVWTRNGVDDVGLFDENFWPAYYEDYEYRIRLELAGNKVASAGILVNHSKPRCGGINYDSMIKGCGLFNRHYLIRKWGALQEPMWKNPFNRDKPLKEWHIERGLRVERESIWNLFMSLSNASVYV